MASQDDLTLLKEMYQRGEISNEQYDVLRRHVLWGTPLPQLMDDVPAPRSAAPPPAPPAPPPPRSAPSPPAAAPVGRGRHASSSYQPDDPLTAPWRPDTGFVPAATPPPAAPPPSAPPRSGPPPSAPPPGYRSAGEPPRSHRPAEPPPGAGLGPPREAPRRRRRAEDDPPTSFPAPAAYRPPGEPPTTYRPPGEPPTDHRPPGEPPTDYRPPGEPPTDHRPAGEPPTDYRRSEPGRPPATRRPPDQSPGAYSPSAHRLAGEPPAGYRPPAALRPAEEPSRSRRGEDGPPTVYGLPPYRPDEADAYRADGETPGLGQGAAAPRRRELDEEPDHDPDVPAVPDRPHRPARRGQKLFAVLTSMLLALALVAAGVWWFALRETGVDAATYARSICSSVRDWQRQVDASSSALVKAIPREEDRTKVRATVQRYYTDLATRTDALRTAIGGAGPVDVPGGRAYADSLTAAVGDQSGTMRELAGRAGRLDAAAATVFQISLQALLTGGETAVSEITAALARPAAGTPAALRAALSDEPACAPYVG